MARCEFKFDLSQYGIAEAEARVESELDGLAEKIAAEAQRLAPVDKPHRWAKRQGSDIGYGPLRESIKAKKAEKRRGRWSALVVADAFYAPFVHKGRPGINANKFLPKAAQAVAATNRGGA